MANFTMFAGDTKVLVVSVLDEAKAVVNITGTSIRWELAKNVKTPPALITKSVGQGITIVDGPNGKFNITLDPADTETLVGTYYYEGEIDDGGIISTVVTGTVQINATLVDPVVVSP